MVVPADWKEVRLGDIAEVKTGPFGSALHASDYVLRGTPIITVEHLGEFQLLGTDAPQVSDKDRNRLSMYSLRLGDIVFSRVGSIGRFGCVTESEVGWLFSGRLLRVRLRIGNPRFLYYQFCSQKFIRQIGTVAVGQTMPSLNTVLVGNLSLALPSLKEQEAIAEALSDADAAIESLDSLIAKKRDVKQATMQQLLTGRTRLPGFTADWKEVRLGDHASMRSGGTPLTSVASFYGGTIPWASISDMSASGKYLGATDRYITEAGLASSPAVVFPEGVLLYAMYASIGECCISVCPMATSQAILGIKCANDLSLEFLYYTMQSKRAEIVRSGQQGTQANLNAQMVRETMFLMPALKEQEAIAEALGVIDDELEALTEQVSKMRMVKEGMMQDLLTGKVRLV